MGVLSARQFDGSEFGRLVAERQLDSMARKHDLGAGMPDENRPPQATGTKPRCSLRVSARESAETKVSITVAKTKAVQSPTTRRPAVCIVDDHDQVRHALKCLLDSTNEFQVVGTYARGLQALDSIPGIGPDLVLLDIWMPGMSGLEVGPRLKALLPELIIVYVSVVDEPLTKQRALESGGDDYVVKSSDNDELLERLRVALWRRVGLKRTSEPHRPNPEPHSKEPPPAWSEPDIRLGRLLAEGLQYGEMSDRMNVSLATLKKLMFHLYQKKGVHNRTELVNLLSAQQDKCAPL